MATIAVNPSADNIPRLPTYHQRPETKYELDWADLVTLDLSQFDEPGGKQKLAAQLFDAIQHTGFFNIVNFGLTQEQVDEQFALCKAIFDLSDEEKLPYRAEYEKGSLIGWKPPGLRQEMPGIRDNLEMYNVAKFVPGLDRAHLALVEQNRDKVEFFTRHINRHIAARLLVLFAIILELPEDYFLRNHRYEARSGCHLRYMKYHKRTPEENEALNDVWVRGHTDFGSMTLLFRQPVAALQVRTPEDEWKWVRPLEGSITVNVADSLSFLSNGFLRSSIHRVVVPPPDQRDEDRLGLLYFMRADDDLELRPVQNSPVLTRLGYDKVTDASAVGITAAEWVRARVKTSAGEAKPRETHKQEIFGKTVKYWS